MRFSRQERFPEHRRSAHVRLSQNLNRRKEASTEGPVGYLDFAGNVDTCISIRLAYKKNGYIRVQSGAGIVADSIPENEFQECLNKAGAVLQAVETAKGGLE